MKKKLLISAVSIAAAVLGSVQAYAQENEKVVTGKITLMSPTSVEVLDEYISNQIYTGTSVFSGINARLGAIYRKHENLSWDLYYTSYDRPQWRKKFGNGLAALENPAKTQELDYNTFNVGYGTYYHWKFGEKLMLKTGGVFDIYGANKKSTPDGVNNMMNIDAQLMIKAHAAIKYGWDFKKWSLDLRALVTLPVIGLIAADHPSESSLSIIGNSNTVLNPAYNHIFMASYHNYMSLDYEFGVDFVTKPCTITLGFGSTRKWWNIYDLQNIRKINYLTIGVSFDIVSREKFKSSNINF